MILFEIVFIWENLIITCYARAGAYHTATTPKCKVAFIYNGSSNFLLHPELNKVPVCTVLFLAHSVSPSWEVSDSFPSRPHCTVTFGFPPVLFSMIALFLGQDHRYQHRPHWGTAVFVLPIFVFSHSGPHGRFVVGLHSTSGHGVFRLWQIPSFCCSEVISLFDNPITDIPLRSNDFPW